MLRIEPHHEGSWIYSPNDHKDAEFRKVQLAEQAETILGYQRKRDETAELRRANEGLGKALEEARRERDALRSRLGAYEDELYKTGQLASANETIAKSNQTIASLIKQRDEARQQRDASLQDAMRKQIELSSYRDNAKTFADQAEKHLLAGNETLRKLEDANLEIKRQKGWLDSAVALQNIHWAAKMDAEEKLVRIQKALLELPHAHAAPEEALCIRCQIERAMDGR